jgi:hypothetical protein
MLPSILQQNMKFAQKKQKEKEHGSGLEGMQFQNKVETLRNLQQTL